MARAPLPDPGWPTADEAARSRLFSPLVVGRLSLADRTWVPAMVPWRASEEGFVTPALLAWYGRFAEGTPAAIVVEATGIRDVPSGPLLRVGDDRFVAGLAELVDVIRARSGGRTRAFLQLIDFLAIKRRVPAATYLGRFLTLDDHHRRRLADLRGEPLDDASDDRVRAELLRLGEDQLAEVLRPRELEDLRQGYRERVDDLHLPHVRALPAELPERFARAAARAERAGFDGVELHYAHAYTMASFLSRRNQRDDGYGGSLDGRLRLPREVLAAVRSRVGAGFVVGARILAEECIDGGSDVHDAELAAVELARVGLDFLSLSRGGKFEDARQPKLGEAAYPYTGPSGAECMPTVYAEGSPFGRALPASRRIRAALRAAGFATPVVAAGGLHTFALAEAALASGDLDVVGVARQSLADPDWPRKVRAGRGASVRRCQLTNYCEALDQRHHEVTCRLWDRLPGEAPRSRDGRRRLVAPPDDGGGA